MTINPCRGVLAFEFAHLEYLRLNSPSIGSQSPNGSPVVDFRSLSRGQIPASNIAQELINRQQIDRFIDNVKQVLPISIAAFHKLLCHISVCLASPEKKIVFENPVDGASPIEISIENLPKLVTEREYRTILPYFFDDEESPVLNAMEQTVLSDVQYEISTIVVKHLQPLFGFMKANLEEIANALLRGEDEFTLHLMEARSGFVTPSKTKQVKINSIKDVIMINDLINAYEHYKFL